jgi:hypothetical protein
MHVEDFKLILPYAPERAIALPKPGFQASEDIYHGVDSHLDFLPYRNRYLDQLIPTRRSDEKN